MEQRRTKQHQARTLGERARLFEFRPEVYIYPPHRMYRAYTRQEQEDFSLENVAFSEDINIYVHIPFCRQICSFCGYLKTLDRGDDARDAYTNAVVREIGLYAPVLGKSTIKTLHIGGGTPSLLTCSQLEQIIGEIERHNPLLRETVSEISIEATPESVTSGTARRWRSLGIDRVSIGIQSLDDREIALSRRHNNAQVSLGALRTLREAGIGNIVADVMIGIEGQSVESFERTVRTLIGERPDTVELYALGVMPNTLIAKKEGQAARMSNEDIYRCYSLGRELFLFAGYVQDCHNRYALPGRGSFLQEDYVFEGMSLIGLGAGTRTYADNIHYRNSYDDNAVKAIKEYEDALLAGKFAVRSGIALTEDERMRKYAIGHIESLDKDAFRSRFNLTFNQAFPHLSSQLAQAGLTTEDSNHISLTPKGLDFRDLISWELFSDEVRAVEEKYRKR